MATTLESLGLPPRKMLVLSTIDRETVHSIIRSERTLLYKALELGVDLDVVQRGFEPYLNELRSQLTAEQKAEFDRLLVDEAMNDEALKGAEAELAEAEFRLAESEQEHVEAQKKFASRHTPKPLSTTRAFLAGVNITILIGCALFWIFR